MWQNYDYLRLFSAQIISLIGTGISSICLTLIAYDLAGEDAGIVLSIIFSIKILTYIFLAPVFSTFAHKFRKRQTLVTLDIIRALILLSLPFVTDIWQVYLLMFIINACSAWFTPQFQSVLPLILPNKTQYIKALSLSRLAFDLEQIASPILTALLLTSINFKFLFMFDSATFVISAIFILLCTFPNTKQLTTKKSLNFYQLTKTIRDYLGKPKLKALWFAYLAVASASAMVLVNTVTYVHQILNGGDKQTAFAMMAVGFGSIFIALNLPLWLKKHKPQQFHWTGMVTISVALTLGIFTPGWFGYIAICLLLGIGMSCIQTTSGLIITENCSEEESSQYFAAHFSLTHFWWLIAYLTAGVSASVIGIGYSYLCMDILSLMSVFGYYIVITKGNN